MNKIKNLIIKRIDENDKDKIIKIIEKEWGSRIIVSKGKKYNINDLPGFIAKFDNKIVGIITYYINNKKCEIISLNVIKENIGIGTKLIEQVKLEALNKKCKKILLITTNDNINAIKFYQKKGFNIKKVNINAIKRSRKIKPGIPEKGFYNIPILHEVEFELKIK